MKDLLRRIKLFLFKTQDSDTLIQQALNQKAKSEKLSEELTATYMKLEEIKEEARELQATIEEEKEAHLYEAKLAHEEMLANLDSQYRGQIRTIKEQANSEIEDLERIFYL